MSRVLHHDGAFAYAARLLRSAMARRLARHRAVVGAPRIACFPSDDIGARIIAHGWYEDVLLRALFDGFFAADAEAFRGGTALDVGANIGNHSMWFARRFARVLAFEPNPICTRLLEASLLMNEVENVVLFQMGLSDADTQATFHSNQHGNLGRSGVDAALAQGATRSFPVPLRRGDAVLADVDLGATPLRLVKLDIEGHELAALRGLAGTLRRHQPVVLFESHRADGPGGSDAIVALLQECGYRHFHVIEADAAPFRPRLAKAAWRLLHGWSLRVREVARPENRSYSLVVARVTPRCAS